MKTKRLHPISLRLDPSAPGKRALVEESRALIRFSREQMVLSKEMIARQKTGTR